jgi:hypothetical protein
MDSLSEGPSNPSIPSSKSAAQTDELFNSESKEFDPEQSLSGGSSSKGASPIRKEDGVFEYIPRQTPRAGGKNTLLVSLWEDSFAKYRKTADLTPVQEKMLSEVPKTMDGGFESSLVEWEAFRNPPKSGKLIAKVKDKLTQAVRVLQEKIPVMDVVIGYPTQAVCMSLILADSKGVSTECSNLGCTEDIANCH